jgi:hypothetical protein
MIYLEPKLSIATPDQLKLISNSIKNEFPNGPKVKTVYPDKTYGFNEIAQNIRTQLISIGGYKN